MKVPKSKLNVDANERFRRIVLLCCSFSFLGITLLYMGSGLYPLYKKLEQASEQQVIHETKLTARSVAEFFRGIKNVAKQIASRTQARKLLYAHNQGTIDHALFQERAGQILNEALSADDNLLGIVRFDQQGERVLAVGKPLAEDWLPKFTNTEDIRVADIKYLHEEVVFLVTAPIFDNGPNRIGTDVTLFAASSLHNAIDVSSDASWHDGYSAFLVFSEFSSDLIVTPLLSPDVQILSSRRDIDKWQPGLWKAVDNLHSSPRQRIFEEKQNLFSSLPLREVSAEIIVRIDRHSILREIQLSTVKVVLVSLLLAILGMILIYGLVGYFLRTQLSESREFLNHLRTVLETVVDGIITIDSHGLIQSFNPAAEKLFGYQAQEVMGRNISLLMPEPHASLHDSYIKQYCDTGNAKIIGIGREAEGRRRDGTMVPVELTVGEMNVNGQKMFTGIVRDIRQRKEREQELKNYAERLDLATRSGGIGIWDYNLVENTLEWDEQMYRLYGVDPEQFQGQYQDWSSAVHPEDLPRAENEVDEALAGTKDFDTEFRIVRPDGAVKTVKSAATVIRNDLGHAERMIGVNWDITDRKRVMKELDEARVAAEAANLAKSAFLATMSHEIRTPMNGVLGMAELLAHSPLSDEQSELTAAIQDSSQHLLSLIDDILDFSKIEAGQLEVEPGPFNLPPLIEGIASSLAPVAANKGVSLDLYIAPQIPEWLFSDEVRLRQVLYNLVGNAVKFSADESGRQGVVSLRVELVDDESPQLRFSISDNGIGMTKEVINKLFSPFTQGEVSTTRRFGGTGLGLAICKRLIELMQGEIRVESTPGVGSTFTVILPCEEAAEQPTRDLPDIAFLNCILVSSTSFRVKDLRDYLEYDGARVQLVDTLSEAVSHAVSLPAPVIVIHGPEHQPVSMDESLDNVEQLHRLVINRAQHQYIHVENASQVSLDYVVLKRGNLLRAVAVAAGRASPDLYPKCGNRLSLKKAKTPLSIDDARSQGRLILVAEDDLMNQKVILRQLALIGYVGEVVNNGVQALQHLREGHYDLLLTDLHMPEMDGYTLASLLRKEESGPHRLPILALTANALRGEANRAKAAGIDDFLTKPISLRELSTALTRWLGPVEEELIADNAPSAALDNEQDVSIFNVGVLQGLVGHDAAILHELLSDYLASLQKLSVQLFTAYAAGDIAMVGAIAHKLKSSSRSTGALPLGELCARMEVACKNENHVALKHRMSTFETAVVEVMSKVDNLLKEKQLQI